MRHIFRDSVGGHRRGEPRRLCGQGDGRASGLRGSWGLGVLGFRV